MKWFYYWFSEISTTASGDTEASDRHYFLKLYENLTMQGATIEAASEFILVSLFNIIKLTNYKICITKKCLNRIHWIIRSP